MMRFDVVVIGAGPAGLAAAKHTSKNGYKTLLIERDERLGGILNQCIHNGFGLKLFNQELTGPEYIHQMLKDLKNENLTIFNNTFVTKLEKNKVEITNAEGVKCVKTKAIIVATGARERTAGEIRLLGSRPSGVYTAGFAQKMINHHGKLVGKKAVILGSGDIGLILARRLVFEGATVAGIYEIGKTSSGLQRNITQCVEDFNIPLEYETTIVEVVGKNKVEGVWVAKVDENKQPIFTTKKYIECDCVLLSVGLIPDIELINKKVELDKFHRPVVTGDRQTSKEGIFVCGNALHIHDLADNASLEGTLAGIGAIEHIKSNKSKALFDVKAGKNVSYCIPQKVEEKKPVTIYFRSNRKLKKATIKVAQDGEVIAQKFCPAINGGELQEIELKNGVTKDIEVFIDGGEA